MLRIIFASMIMMSSVSAYAIFDGQLLLGKRYSTYTTEGNSDTGDGTEVTLAAHVDPIPLVPVAIGAYYTMVDYKLDDDGDAFALDTFSGGHMGVELMAWTPALFANLSLFAKAGYTFYGSYTGEDNDYALGDGSFTDLEAEYNLKNGTKFGAGIKWSPIFLVSALLEVDFTSEKIELDKLKAAGQTYSSTKVKTDVKSTSVLLGVSAGF